jgi:hypothetical protein
VGKPLREEIRVLMFSWRECSAMFSISYSFFHILSFRKSINSFELSLKNQIASLISWNKLSLFSTHSITLAIKNSICFLSSFEYLINSGLSANSSKSSCVLMFFIISQGLAKSGLVQSSVLGLGGYSVSSIHIYI